MTRFRAELILFLIASLWAGTFPVIKTSVETFPPFLFISIRFIIAAILFSAVYYKTIPLDDLKSVKAGLVLAFFQMTGFGSQTLGMVYTSASNSALITGICILFVPLVQYLLIKKTPAIENWAGIGIVTIGLYFLTQPFELGYNKGDLITLICTFSWAFYIVLLDPFSKKYNITVLIFVQFWSVAIASLVISVIFENYSNIGFAASDFYSLAYLGIAATLVTTTLGNRYQKYTTPVRASIIFTWEQPAAVMLAIFFLGEKFSSLQLIGGILMIAGILFSETYEFIRKKPHPPTPLST